MNTTPPAVPPSEHKLVITRRTDRSLPMLLLHTLMRPFRPRAAQHSDPVPEDAPRLTPPKSARKHCDISERQVDGIWLYDVTLKDAKQHDAGRKRIYYLCGGGWQMPPTNNHWAMVTQFVQRIPNVVLSVIAYPTAPRNPARISMPRLRKMYDSIMLQSEQNNERVIFAGDSSGGNIAICLVMSALMDPDTRAPAAILGISASADLRHTNPKLEHVVPRDPLFTLDFIKSTASAWTEGKSDGGENQDKSEWGAWDPRVSPILADPEPLVRHGVKLHGITGTYDLLGVETAEFRDQCRDAGVEGEWLEWEKQMHCFPLAARYRLKECTQGLDWIIDVLTRT